MQIKLSDQELTRISRYSFIGLIGISLVYIFLANSFLSDYAIYAFFIAYSAFFFSTALLDRRKKQRAVLKESAAKQTYRTIRGALIILIGIFVFVIAGALLLNVL